MMYRVIVKQGDASVKFHYNDEYLMQACEFASNCLEVGTDDTSITISQVESEDE